MQAAKTVILTLFILIIITFASMFIFIYTGIFNVSAQQKDNYFIHWLLTTTRKYSVGVRADKIKSIPDLNDPKRIMEGFQHYQEMCVECHRAPGLSDSELSQGLNPQPPNFSQLKSLDLTPAEIFWIIKNGIRMTGMPSWGATHDDEKIWALTAFVSQLPEMKEPDYQAMDMKAGSEEEHHHKH